MYAFIAGKIAEKSPTYVILDNHGIGYFINITLNTFTAIGEKDEVKLYLHEQILEDAHNLFGFYSGCSSPFLAWDATRQDLSLAH